MKSGATEILESNAKIIIIDKKHQFKGQSLRNKVLQRKEQIMKLVGVEI